MIKVELSNTQSLAWRYLEDDSTEEIIYGGGAGGGKSFLLSAWHIYRRTKYPRTRGMIGRAKISTLEQSTLVTLFKVASLMGYKPDIHYKYNQQKNIIKWRNGSVTILKDLFFYPSDPEYTSLGSTEYTDVCIDEVTEIKEKAYEIVNSRIRWMLKEYGLIPKILCTCNPSPNWVRDRFVMDDYGNKINLPKHTKFIRSLVSDNPDRDFVKSYTNQLSKLNEYDKNRLLYGDWMSKEKVNNPFAYSFNRSCIRDDINYNDNIPIIISIDFNINPFVCLVFQHFYKEGYEHVHIVDEIILDSGSIPSMCEEIKKRYENKLMTMRITGDYSGMRRDISNKDTAHYYTQIQRILGISNRQIITPVNPHHEKSRQDVNYFLSRFKNFYIKSTCKNIIFDLENVECDINGKIIKERREYKEQRSDALDCFRYFVNAFMLEWIKRTQKMEKLNINTL